MAEGGTGTWIDLLDPAADELGEHVPRAIRPEVLEHLLRPAHPEGDVRPTLQGHGEYVFGVLVVPVLLPERDKLFYQEVNLVLTRDHIVTVRKTPPDETPWDPRSLQEVCDARGALPPGEIAHHLLDDVAERYIDVLDAVDEEIDELEENVEGWTVRLVYRRLTELRRGLLHIRRTLSPTRDAVRAVVDGRVDISRRRFFGSEVFPRELELEFAGVYDKLLRATEALELARDLLAAVRDYHQSRIANDQNDVVKRLTAIAALILFPTFWVGLYGQNFRHMPELRWRLGYAYSWAVIVVVTIVQLIYFRRKRWL